MELSCHCSVYHPQVPSSGFDLSLPGLGCCCAMPHPWLLSSDFDFSSSGQNCCCSASTPGVLNHGFVPTSLELNRCHSVNAPWGQSQDLDSSFPGCTANASYCCTLLSQSLCQGWVPQPRPESLWRLPQEIRTGWHLRHQCHCHSKYTYVPCLVLCVSEARLQLHYHSECQHTTITCRISTVLATKDPPPHTPGFANTDLSSWGYLETIPLCPPRNQICCTPPSWCPCSHLQG